MSLCNLSILSAINHVRFSASETRTSRELIFSMLGEASTKEIAVNQNAQGFDANKTAAKTGGRIAGDARRHLEKESGKPVISKENYLDITSLKPIEIDEPIEN